jgi:arylsulfatase A-like enzyme
MCTPTRGQLLTGIDAARNGAVNVSSGRTLLRADLPTLADLFRANGYATGMFGKWHLGDNYPYRPQDRGFEHVVAHKGGGVGQQPDFWGNDYFDDTYFHNGAPVPHSGYCTDVWFDEATKFIEAHRDEPFFAYVATNAPHAPYLVDGRYAAPYRRQDDIPEPCFYGMITNIDENFGRLRATLSQLGIADDTLLIFMTDNGSSGGCTLDPRGFVTRGYNAGMRGKKGSYYEGGHRVSLLLRHPAGGLAGGRDVDEMCLDVDLLPTFIDLLGLTPPRTVAFDGQTLAPLLRGRRRQLDGDRVHFLQQRQSTSPPEKWTCAVMTRQWRLVGGQELYAVRDDPEQRHDVAAEHPDVLARLRAAYEDWWDEISPRLGEYCPISIGSDRENPTRLDSMDVTGDVAWNQGHVIAAIRASGTWQVRVERTGRYRISLRRWPAEIDLPIDAPASGEMVADCAYGRPDLTPVAIRPVRARAGLFGHQHTLPVAPGDHDAAFEITVEQTGRTQLDAYFVDHDGREQGAYYVYVERLERPQS